MMPERMDFYRGLTGIAALKQFYIDKDHEVIEMDNGQLLVSATPKKRSRSIWERVQGAIDHFVWGG